DGESSLRGDLAGAGDHGFGSALGLAHHGARAFQLEAALRNLLRRQHATESEYDEKTHVRNCNTTMGSASELVSARFFFGRFRKFLRLYLCGPIMSQGLCTSFIEHPEPEKLSRLRAKTDAQLLDLIHSRLASGADFAAVAESELADGNRASAEQSLACADQAAAEVRQLLRAVREQQRLGLESNLNALRLTLERLRRQMPQ